jgi:hypothetical protein
VDDYNLYFSMYTAEEAYLRVFYRNERGQGK